MVLLESEQDVIISVHGVDPSTVQICERLLFWCILLLSKYFPLLLAEARWGQELLGTDVVRNQEKIEELFCSIRAIGQFE